MREGKNNCWSGQCYLCLYLKEVFCRNNYTLFRFRKLASLSQRTRRLESGGIGGIMKFDKYPSCSVSVEI